MPINGFFLLGISRENVRPYNDDMHVSYFLYFFSAPQVAVTILRSVTEFAPEPQRLDRYRNELAASMLGIPATKMNEDGLLLLQKLVAIAPHPDSDIVFMPQQR